MQGIRVRREIRDNADARGNGVSAREDQCVLCLPFCDTPAPQLLNPASSPNILFQYELF